MRGEAGTRGDRGAVAILVALTLTPVLLGAAALGVDVARWFAVLERVQRAADASALAAAPQWLTDRPAARAAALDAARRNGFASDVRTRVTLATADSPGTVRVTITTRVNNPLGALLGTPTRELTRSAEATYAHAVAMGSTCNLFGNEPDPATGTGSDPADGSGSVMSSLCPMGRRPHFWATVAGPDTSKLEGDRYATRWCNPGNSGCSPPRNTEYAGALAGPAGPAGPAGDGSSSYFFRVSVRRPVASISVQVFDPAFVDVGNWCERMPRTSGSDPSWPGPNRANPFVTDADRRYAFGSPASSPSSSGDFCTGDFAFNAPGTPAESAGLPVTTSMAVHSPHASGDPWSAPVIAACVRQYPSWSMSPDALRVALTASTRAARALQRVFRQWVTVCTVRAPQVGDYYLQVRTNVLAGSATAARMTDPREDSGASGGGLNRFAIRVDSPGDEEAVTLSAVERMAVYANLAGGATTFLLARVPSASAGSTLRVELFDIGDAVGTTSLRLLPPPAASGRWVDSCSAAGDVRGSVRDPVPLAGCRLGGIGAETGFNGRVQRIDVTIPGDYRCRDDTPTDCWFRVEINYAGLAYDTTTWTAILEGDPVRLVR